MNAQSSAPPIDWISSLCESAYGRAGHASRLGGENHNYLIETDDGRRYVLKLAGDEISEETIELGHRMVEHLHASGVAVALPRVIPSSGGSTQVQKRTTEGRIIRARLLEFVPGTSWSEAGQATPGQFQDLGRMLAEIDRALSSFDPRAAHRTHRWDLAVAAQHRGKAEFMTDPDRRRMVEWMFHFYAARALPKLSNLPHSLIHADANDENVLVEGGKISGLLDFGDSLHNPTICELAIAITYAMLGEADPLQVGADIAAAYHSVRPLSEDETDVLYPLICGRLSMSVAIAAERRRTDPAHPSWFVTEERAWTLIEKLYAIDPEEAEGRLASAISTGAHHNAGAPVEVLLEKRKRNISDTLAIHYREPLKILRGQGQYLFDHRGRPFLDLVNNVCHVGHCHPRVVEAGQRQMERLNTNTRYLYDGLTEYAERLCATLPEPLDTCLFVNSGSEANELALRLAMTYTGRRDFLVVDGGYHGNTQRLTDISPYKFMGKGGTGRPEPWVHVVPMPDGFRGKHRGQGRATGVAYGNEVKRVIDESNSEVAGFIAESILSCGGQIVPPEGYFETAFEHVHAAGGVCIIDEVQVGFGRVGTHFWGFETQGVIPDIIVMGKPIGNGHPMAAVVARREVAEAFANGMEYFSTFGGNPVSCAIGSAVLDVIRDEGLQQRALEVGARLMEGLVSLTADHPLIGDVRGAGLFIGVELVRDRSTLEPADAEADELVNRMQARGILLGTDGPLHNVIKIKPPMVLTADDVDMVARILGDELAVLERSMK